MRLYGTQPKGDWDVGQSVQYQLFINETAAIQGWDVFQISYGKRTGILFCILRADQAAGILCAFLKNIETCIKSNAIVNVLKQLIQQQEIHL